MSGPASPNRPSHTPLASSDQIHLPPAKQGSSKDLEREPTVEVVDEGESVEVDEASEEMGDGLEPVPSPSVTPKLEQYIRENLAKYPHAILLTQVGSFFEVSLSWCSFLLWQPGLIT